MSSSQLVLQSTMKCLRCNRDTHHFESDAWTTKYFCQACTEVILMDWLLAEMAMLKLKASRVDTRALEHG